MVYNSIFCHKQRLIWHEFSKITILGLPWLVLGDFNSVLSRNEHKSGSFTYYTRKSRYFADFVDQNNLLDLKFTGSSYTWCNNKLSSARH